MTCAAIRFRDRAGALRAVRLMPLLFRFSAQGSWLSPGRRQVWIVRSGCSFACFLGGCDDFLMGGAVAVQADLFAALVELGLGVVTAKAKPWLAPITEREPACAVSEIDKRDKR